MQEMRLTVSKLAEEAGVTTDSIRHYERQGLLPPPPRTPAGYRSYDASVVDRIRFIKGAQRFGLRLREVRELLDIRDKGACPCGHTASLVARRIAEIDSEMARLDRLRADLIEMAAEYPQSCSEPGPTGWPCETQFIEAGR